MYFISVNEPQTGLPPTIPSQIRFINQKGKSLMQPNMANKS